MSEVAPPLSVPLRVYRKFLDYALEHASPQAPRGTWKEVIGFLVGRVREKKELTISDVICEGVGTTAHVSVEDYARVISSLVETGRIKDGESIIGWIHSHPGLGLFYSGTDIRTQTIYQKLEPSAVGLVLDPSVARTSTGGPGIAAYVVSEDGEAVSIPVVVEDFELALIPTEAEVAILEEVVPVISSESERLVTSGGPIQLVLRSGLASTKDRFVVRLFCNCTPAPGVYYEVEYGISVYGCVQRSAVWGPRIRHRLKQPSPLAWYTLERGSEKLFAMKIDSISASTWNQETGEKDIYDLGDLVVTGEWSEETT